MRTAYMCEYCKTVYDMEDEAKKCEDSHLKACEFHGVYEKRRKHPVEIKVLFFENGTIYKKTYREVK